MTKVKERCSSGNKASENNSSTILDTLEVTSDSFLTKHHETLYNSALRKGRNMKTFMQLIDVAEPKRQKQYWKSWHCNAILLQNETVLQGSLCRKRWCSHCNRIRTAELIKGYHEPLKDLQQQDNLYFVTLTAPTVSERKLRSEITKRYKAFTRVKDNLRKNYGIKLNGIRSTEVTFTAEEKFHPHFHMIVQGYKHAHALQSLWLDQPLNAGIKGQHIRQINPEEERNLLEVFKYAVKGEAKNETEAKAYDHIYKCLEGIRTIQTFGTIRKVKPPKKETTERINCDWIEPQFEVWVFDQNRSDYTNAKYETLIGTQEITKRLLEAKKQNQLTT